MVNAGDVTAGSPFARRELGALLLGAALLFTANALRLSLPALDDCFYARKGVEMARSGGFFDVTWNGRPAFQNPPLQIWLVGRSMALFGENDFAARLPSIAMALAVLLVVYRIGLLTVGAPAAVGAVALLLLSPYFVNNARRCMMEIPLAFWVVLSIWVFLEGRDRPPLLVLFALPLGAAILTKSVLGLLPLGIVLAGAAVEPRLREPFRRPYLWLGIAGGVLLGATWSLHQLATVGPAFVREHYGREILARSTERPDLRSIVSSYPLALLTSYQPVVLPALVGAALLWKRRRDPDSLGAPVLLVVWIALPVLAYSLSSARSPKYVFPVFPPLALCASDWISRRWPTAAAHLRSRLAPAVLVAGAIVFWVKPELLVRSGTAVFKQDRQVAARVPPGEPIAYLASRYDWGLANPLLYYSERYLEPPADAASAAEEVERARGRRSGLLMVERARLSEIPDRARGPVVLEGASWLLLDVSERSLGRFVDTPGGSR